MNWSGKF